MTTPPKPSPQGEFEGSLISPNLSEAMELVAERRDAFRRIGLTWTDKDVVECLLHRIPVALCENERLKGEVERVSDLAHRLAKLFHAAAQASWDGYDLDGGTIQSLGEELRLLEREPYDPDKHGEAIDADPGDEIFTLADDVRAALNPLGGQG